MPHTSSTLKDISSEYRTFFGRIVFTAVFILILTLGLLTRLIYLQIVGHEHYATLAKKNRVKIVPLAPTRGIIYDRHGKTLAENVPSYSLELIPEQIENMDDTLQQLQHLLKIPDEKIEQFHRQRKRQKSFTGIPLLLRLTDREVARFAAVRPYFPGVDIHARLIRHYPYADLTAHVVGYVGRINEQELKTLPSAEYRGTHHVGKVGIEKTYESQLHGQVGFAEVETNAKSRPINQSPKLDPIPGANIYLNLDIDLQKTAFDALEDYNGAVVAIEIKTGGVLVFASRPSFDPNLFVTGISRKAYQELRQSDNQPLFNRALQGRYPPGSTIKPFIGLAGLEYHALSHEHTINCPGYFRLPNVSHKYRDWKKWGHGKVNLDDAIIQSCDVYFYNLAHILGIDHLHDFLQQFGFGEKTNIDLNGEKSGLLPSRDWKRKAKNQPWYPGETLITGIGQGFTQVTPLQLAKATGSLANKGMIVTPKLAERIVTTNATTAVNSNKDELIPLALDNIEQIITAMINVVHGKRGTARRISKDINYQIAGKTGTAQVYSVKQEETYNEEEIDLKLRDHALFIAFAPAHDPQIAIAVVVENGGHGGSVAAPIAGKVIKQYLRYNPPS